MKRPANHDRRAYVIKNNIIVIFFGASAKCRRNPLCEEVEDNPLHRNRGGIFEKNNAARMGIESKYRLISKMLLVLRNVAELKRSVI